MSDDIRPPVEEADCSREVADSSDGDTEIENDNAAHADSSHVEEDPVGATQTVVQPEPATVTQVMNPNAASFQPSRNQPAREKKSKPKVKWADESQTGIYAALASVGGDLEEPLGYESALNSPQFSEWMSAMREEIDSLSKNGTWTLSKLPTGRNAIKNRWVYKLKPSGCEDGVKFKARLVAKGFFQKPGIDYEEFILLW